MSDQFPVLWWRWDAARRAMIPVSKGVEGWFVDGERYRLEPREERSARAHRWFFVTLKEVHQSLPDELADRFPSPDHLRKWALVKSGHADEDTSTFDTEKDARAFARWVRKKDDFAVITLKDTVVRVFTAKSQSTAAMDGPTFKKSVEDVLRVIADLTGNTVAELRRAGESA